MYEHLYCYVLYSPRPDYGVKPTFIHVDEVPAEGGFTSLYRVTKETAEAISEVGTAAGFKGVVWGGVLQLDVDDYEKADIVEQRLKELYLEYKSYDTGGRGVHFSVRRNALPSHILPMQDKQWVQETFPEADRSIYTHLHPLRLPGTPHKSGGGRKRLVEEHPGRALVLPPYSFTPQEPIREGYGGCPSIGQKSIFDEFLIMRNSVQAKEGERHPQLVRLLYSLRDLGYSKEIARWWCNEVNKRFQPPKAEEEIEKAIQSIYR